MDRNIVSILIGIAIIILAYYLHSKGY
ncbi:hypothetical protein CMTB2_05557 [Caminibacter mediatlanticus TB-2]|uniref:Uncharacterized protein n=1 Tax=Caminibacter mediatlanticus TB-2 TaxID=391592 RepID=A0AAI9AFT9_9BACT|nr:hypothetical protein CMTB2_09251 [Caminibacter mediatlanticus TB-2]EDM22946.1 hypothetical protein CMTB2_05557 [Caminibacter mediatlanticus TB-2]